MFKLNNLFNKKKQSVRDTVILSGYKILKEYSDWYAEHGLYLPPGYETDPGSWTNELQRMVKSFELLYGELHGEGDLWEANNKWKDFGEKDISMITDLNHEVTEGLKLFGKNLLYLTDVIKEDGSTK